MSFPKLNSTVQFIATPNSSNVIGYGYTRKNQTIRVWFKGGMVYDYYNRPWTLWLAFRLAESKGQFVHEYLTPGKNYKRVYG